MMMRQ